MLHSHFSPPNLSTSEVPAANPNLVYAVSQVRLDVNHGHSFFRQRPRNTELPSFCWAPNYPYTYSLECLQGLFVYYFDSKLPYKQCLSFQKQDETSHVTANGSGRCWVAKVKKQCAQSTAVHSTEKQLREHLSPPRVPWNTSCNHHLVVSKESILREAYQAPFIGWGFFSPFTTSLFVGT